MNKVQNTAVADKATTQQGPPDPEAVQAFRDVIEGCGWTVVEGLRDDLSKADVLALAEDLLRQLGEARS
jgi:hypothetical protein